MKDELSLIEAVLKGYPDSIAKADALNAVSRLQRATLPEDAGADKALRKVWSILGPLPAPICNGCADELTRALETMRDYFGSNEYPAAPATGQEGKE